MRPARLLERAALPLTGVSAALFAALSKVRGKRFFHPRGVSFEGTVTFAVGSELPFDGTHAAFARLSRGIGLPARVPDVLGLAVKIPTLGQDFLFATSGENAVTRHLLAPSSGFFRSPYSSVLPYEWDGRMIVLGARAAESLSSLGADIDDIARHVQDGDVRFDLTWGRAGTNEVATFGSLSLDRIYTGDLVFNPFNTSSVVRPAGALNRLRRETYMKSQEARPDTHKRA